ncbi:MAG: AAA family ATPase, partial [Eubacteriaceae bacterium]|nr:AAA family ATPase [Eubacteriaceae bacterium]
EQSMQSYNYAIRELMRLKSTDSYLAENLHTTVGEVVNTSDEYAAAVTEALGASASNLITTDEKAAARCIELLKRNSWGRATFLPIKIIKAQTNGDIKSALKNAEGYLGCADELVETQEIYRPIVSSILSRTAVFRDLNCANSAAAASGHRFKMVTLGGEILYAGGAITGGRHKNNDNGSIMRRNEINRLEQEVNREKDTYDKLLNSQENSAEDEIASLREEMAAEYERIKNSEERAKYFEEQLNYRRNKAERLEGEKQEILKTIENGKHLDARYKEESASAEEQFRKLTEQKEKLSENFAEVNEAIISKSREKGELSARIASIAADKTAVDMEIAHLQADMMDDYGITYAEAKTAPLEEEAEYTDAPEEIARLKERIKRLGNINVDSLEEYRLLRERYENMSAQRDDLAQSREELTKVIDEITRGMEKQFIREFDSIKAEFNKVFRELFGGGEASLELSDPMDVMNSGVDILARPPHTKMRNIGSLSGGEKSMTAIALLFAILDLKPSPFCVLDEIDAALDDANIVRFREYMRRFTADNQFILITHKKLTMEIAEGLYGVSKGADGISRVVSIKLNETEKYGE